VPAAVRNIKGSFLHWKNAEPTTDNGIFPGVVNREIDARVMEKLTERMEEGTDYAREDENSEAILKILGLPSGDTPSEKLHQYHQALDEDESGLQEDESSPNPSKESRKLLLNFKHSELARERSITNEIQQLKKEVIAEKMSEVPADGRRRADGGDGVQGKIPAKNPEGENEIGTTRGQRQKGEVPGSPPASMEIKTSMHSASNEGIMTRSKTIIQDDKEPDGDHRKEVNGKKKRRTR
jgi:hypothetical protein